MPLLNLGTTLYPPPKCVVATKSSQKLHLKTVLLPILMSPPGRQSLPKNNLLFLLRKAIAPPYDGVDHFHLIIHKEIQWFVPPVWTKPLASPLHRWEHAMRR